MSSYLARRTGSAMFWKAFQLGSSKVIFLVRTLILARLLAPDDFGLLAISLVSVGFLVSITNLGMVPALVQHPDPDEQQYDAAWSVGVSRAAFIAVVVFLTAPLVAALFAEPRATNLIRVMALRPLISAAASIRVADLTRDLSFRKLTFLDLPDALVNTIVSIALAPLLGVWALVAGTLAGPLAYLLISYVLAPYRPRFTLDMSAAQPLLRFGRWIFLMSIISVSGSSILQVVISRRLGVAELGLYYLATKLAFIPAEVSSEVVGTVAFPLYARLQGDKHQLARAFRAIFSSVSALLFPICALLIALAPGLVEFVLGPRWAGTVQLIQLLALANVVGLFGDAVSPLLKGAGQPYKLVVIELLQSSLLIGLIWTLTGIFGVLGAALAWIVAVGSAQIVSAFYVRGLLPRSFSELVGPVPAIVVVAAAGGLLAWAIANALPGLTGFVAAGLVASLLTAAALFVLDRTFTFGLARDLLLAFPAVAGLVGQGGVDSS